MVLPPQGPAQAARHRGRRRTLGLHGTVGAWAAAGFVFLLGNRPATWSTYAGGEHRGPARLARPDHPVRVGVGSRGGSTRATARHRARARDAAHGVGLDKVLSAARAEGLGDPVEIVPPADASSAYVIKQVQRSWPEKQDSVAVDPATGEVTDVLRFADYPVLAKLSRWGIDLHTGSFCSACPTRSP